MPSFNSKTLFPFLNLPSLLQHPTLKCLQIDKSLELLEVNRSLRQYILCHGPLPNKIDEFRCMTDLYHKTKISLKMNDFHVEIEFYLGTNHKDITCYNGKDYDFEMITQLNGLNFFRNQKSCRSLNVTVEVQKAAINDEEKLTQFINEFFTNMRFVRDLNIGFNDQTLVDFFFRNFTSKIDFMKFDQKSFDWETLFLSNSINSILSMPSLVNCPNIILEGSDLFWYFPKTFNPSFLHYSPCSLDNFLKIGREFIKNGIPSRNPLAALSIHVHSSTNFPKVYLEEFKRDLLLTRDIIKSSETSLEHNKSSTQLLGYLTEKAREMGGICGDFTAFCKTLYGQQSMEEVFIFKRSLNDEIDYGNKY